MKDLIQFIKDFDHIVIAKHKSPDWDTHGSAYGLKSIIKTNFPSKNVYIVGWDMESDCREKDEAILNEEILEKCLFITVDVANYDRIDFDRLEHIKTIYKIDHHIEVDNFTQFKLVEDNAIACTQVITLWAYDNSLIIDKKAARYLFYGLITDSARFLYKNTNSKSFKAAMILSEVFTEITTVYESLYLKSIHQARWNSKCFSKIKQLKNEKVAYLKIKKKDFKNKNLTEFEVKSSLSIFLNIKEIEVWYIAYESNSSKKIKVSLRSRKHNVNKVAEKFGGGGHILASGLTLQSWKELKLLNKELDKLFKEDKVDE
ncbi:DHH family phosphoesterase [Spiroplasma turonicum]|uniref:DHH family protein n=1 Tax=Spiroplasma turonicum TaxID=216946 RepID=A0A0K1P8R8_9MOLU|nr:bifunctional oligoribonuclease/PAP phosphatase NrnA [Spiroplasma turonicum]AKU80292.1 DHH family protein [Spiroplasma turonicum]ALX71293.1 DHH family protein [Spiroplasma turonicum]